MILSDDEILRIYYFTARTGNDAWLRQQIYLRALETLSLVRIRYGKFRKRTMRCGVEHCPLPADQREYQGKEEKRTDVGIAVQMINDVVENIADKLVVVSGDSDLVPALEWIKHHFPQKRVVAYIPARNQDRGAARELRNAARSAKTLPLGQLEISQLPDQLADADGQFRKPPEWVQNQQKSS